MAEPTDFEIMLHVQGRMPQAFAMLQQRYQSRLFTLARSLGCSVQDSGQVVQRVWTFVWKNAEHFDLERERSVALWLYELTAYYAQTQLANRRLRWQEWLVGTLALVMVFSLGLLGVSFYPRLRQWGVTLARAWVGSPDLGVLERTWRQAQDTRVFVLRGVAGDPPLQGLWSPRHRQLLLVGEGIPTPPAGQVYQLWAVFWQGDDLPTQELESGGTFVGDSEYWLSSPFLHGQPERILITREKQPGGIRPGATILWDSALSGDPE